MSALISSSEYTLGIPDDIQSLASSFIDTICDPDRSKEVRKASCIALGEFVASNPYQKPELSLFAMEQLCKRYKLANEVAKNIRTETIDDMLAKILSNGISMTRTDEQEANNRRFLRCGRLALTEPRPPERERYTNVVITILQDRLLVR